MNKLTNVIINLDTNTLLFEIQLDKAGNIGTVLLLLDECSNVDNIYEDDITKHDYVFNNSNSTITVTKITDTHYSVTIEDMMFANLDDNIKYLRFKSGSIVVEGMYYTPKVIYDAELTHIKKVCSTCLDNKCMQLIMYVTFKRQLLESAIEVNDHKKALELYTDITKMLEISICSNCKCDSTECSSCINGCCSIK